MIDVSAYLNRINYHGPTESTIETLKALHRAHLCAVPFENLDISLDRHIVLDETVLFDKIVVHRRGGFCYELNGLFASLLRRMGFNVTIFSANVVHGGIPATIDHLTLLIQLDVRWIVDVGFGDTSRLPLCLDEAGEQFGAGQRYRFTRAVDRWTLWSRGENDGWYDEYTFGVDMTPLKLSDFESASEYYQTAPESYFVQERICSCATADGRISLTDDKLIVTQNGQRTETPVNGEQDFARALNKYFGIRIVARDTNPQVAPLRNEEQGMKRSLRVLLIAALLALSFAGQRGPSALAENGKPASPAGAPRYTIADLGTLGGVTTKAMGLNEDGQIVGASQNGSYLHGFVWDDGTMTNLGDLGGQGSWAYDVNDANQVVGGSPLSSGNNHAFRWQQNGGMQDLGTLGGPSSYAFEINNSGQAVGYACCAPDTYLSHAVLWSSGGIVDLGDLDPVWPAISAAYGLNDAGQVVGGSYDASANFHAFLWQNGSMQDLGTLGGDYSSAEAINENGQVVGTARLANSTPHAFLWDGAMQDLGALTWDQSIAYDINDKGQVVGVLQTGQNSHAFVWANGQMQDLNNLIPPNSGWVLQEARAINNKGKIAGFGAINGQTRAFLLTPRAYHWINPSGGAWHLTTNWDPQGDPGAGDTVIFALSGRYSVDASTLLSYAPNFSIDCMVISSTNIVDFNNMDLNLVYDSPDEPSLEVNAGGTAHVYSGAATFSHAIIGGEPPANPYNPPIARLQVLGSGTSLTGSGRLTIGDEGVGDLFVTAGGHLTSAEARISGLLATGAGTANVGGDGSLWDTGNIAVGYGISGTLTIQYGGRVNSNDAYVSYGILSEDSQVTVDGISALTSQPSMWALLGSLFVGQSAFGSVEVLNGGSLYVTQDVHITNSELRVDGRHPTGGPSEMDVLGSVFVGGSGSANLLALWNAARGGIEGDLIIGQHGEGAAILWGAANTASPTQLDVVDPAAGLCVIGHTYDGGVSLDDGGLFRCRNIQLGQAGMSGDGSITVDGGMVRALDVLTVGAVGGGTGLVEMKNNALVATNGTYITPNGVITGTGTLAVNFLGLQNDGTLAPGINVMYPFASFAAPQSPAAAATASVATMVISGTLTMGPTGQLVIPLIGNGAGLYGSLAITGTATLDGVLALNFSQGFAPKQGDTFTFLTATGGVSGMFDSVATSSLAPGFEYELTIVDGQLVFEALNDGVPQRMVFLPMVRR